MGKCLVRFYLNLAGVPRELGLAGGGGALDVMSQNYHVVSGRACVFKFQATQP